MTNLIIVSILYASVVLYIIGCLIYLLIKQHNAYKELRDMVANKKKHEITESTITFIFNYFTNAEINLKEKCAGMVLFLQHTAKYRKEYFIKRFLTDKRIGLLHSSVLSSILIGLSIYDEYKDELLMIKNIMNKN